MRLLVCLAVAGLVSAQTPPTPAKPKPPVQLRGDRFQPLSYNTMTPEQKAMTDRAQQGRGAIGVFNVLLRSPEMGEILFQVGDKVRFHSSLPDKMKELAIMINGRYWTTQFEWLVHHRAAVQAGISEATITAIAEGRRPAALPADETAVYNFCVELLNTKQVSDATFLAVKNLYGEKGVVDLIGVTGFYQMVSMFMNVDRYPMATPDQKPELKPLAKPLP